jgi:hypothetical protein
VRALFTALLAGTLVGCASLPDAEKSAVQPAIASTANINRATPAKARKTKAVANIKHATPAKARKTKAVANPEPTGTVMSSRAPHSTKADPVTEKAKAAVAAMLEEPASAEFYDLKRANKKLPHRTVDTICGYVKATDGGETRAMPFLFTLDDGEAYLVNGRSHVSEIVHRHLCK